MQVSRWTTLDTSSSEQEKQVLLHSRTDVLSLSICTPQGRRRGRLSLDRMEHAVLNSIVTAMYDSAGEQVGDAKNKLSEKVSEKLQGLCGGRR